MNDVQLDETVDVVILSLNRKDSVLEAINSVFAQEDVACRIFIVDQGSDEDTLAILRNLVNHGKIVLSEQTVNLGVPGGRTLGMSLGCSPVIISLDDDAKLEAPHAASYVLRRFKESPRLGVISFRVVDYDTGADAGGSWVFQPSQKRLSEERFLTTRFSGGAHAIRRATLDATDGYDANLFFGREEEDLAYQIISAGYFIEYDPTVRVRHRREASGKVSWSTNRFYYLVRNSIYVTYKHFRSPMQVGLLCAGYAIRAMANGVFPQYWRAVRDARVMIAQLSPRRAIVSANARSYIARVEGGLGHRIASAIRYQLLARLPR